MPSSTFNFERPIPALPWRALTFVTLGLTLAATFGWEIYVRGLGYQPTLNDTSDLWAQHRKKVKPDSLVIIGDSRALFDLDLDELEKGLGKRPIQLSLVGSCAYPVLENFAEDETFHGTIITGLVPLMFMVPAGPPIENSKKAIERAQNQTVAQSLSQDLGVFLEEHLAFLKQEDLTLGQLLAKLPIPNRANAQIPPPLPPYFYSLDRDRRARMIESCAIDGPLKTRVMQGWPPLFTPPPPPNWIPKDAFFNGMNEAIEARFKNTGAAVAKIRARGGKVVFVRFPVSGKLKEIENMASPRAGIWTRLLKETQAPGIYYEDHPELAQFTCPEWSHLSAPDSVEFTRRLVPHLKSSLGL